MFNPENTAGNVSPWTALGITLPTELSKAIELVETVRYVEVGRQPVFDIAGITPKNAEDKIREFAEQLALSEAPGGGLSALEKAKKHAIDQAARRVTSLARAAVPAAIEQLTPAFDKHVEGYIDAVAKLPDNISADALLSAGADAVAAYQTAQQEAGYLNQISGWVAQTGYLSGILPKQMEVVLRILRPASALELTNLDDARAVTVNPALQAIEPLFYTAARLGVEFGINTLREAADLRQSLAIRPQQLEGVATLRLTPPTRGTAPSFRAGGPFRCTTQESANMKPTEEEREAAFQSYLETSVPYFEVVESNGDKPWFDSIEERRELFMRRYRPARPSEEIAS